MRNDSGTRSQSKVPGTMALMLMLLTGVAFHAATPAPGDAQSKVQSDSTRHAQSIRIGSDGIRIDGGREGEFTELDARGVVRIGDGVIRITTDSDTQTVRRRSVHINGPVVVVDDASAGLVRVFADAEVAEGERIEGDVVAVFGSVEVAGRVAGNVAAVFGSVSLKPGAVVDGDVVAIGGALDQAAGAIVNGESVSLGLFSWHPGIPTLRVLLLSVLGGWIMTLILGWMLALIFPNRMRRVALTASQRTAGSFVLGVASGPLVVIAIVLMLITVVGIPFALMLPLAYIFIVWAGQLITSYVLGCRLLRRTIGDGQPMAPLFAGTLFVAMFFALGAILAGPQGALRTFALFFTLLGALLVLGLSVVGTGAVLLSRFGSRPRDGAAQTPAAAASPPPEPTIVPATGV